MEKNNRLMELAGISQENTSSSTPLSAEEMANELVKQYKHNIQTESDADHVAGVILGILKKKGYSDRNLNAYASLAANKALNDNRNDVRAKLDAYGLHKEEALKNMKLSGVIREDEFLGDKSGFSDFLGRELIVRRDDKTGLLNFDFDSMGWNYDTTDALEAAAIISRGKYANNAELRALAITEADKQNVTLSEFFYWASGGNKAWRFEGWYSIDVDNAISMLEKEFGAEVTANVQAASNIGDLIDLSKEMKERVFEFMIEYTKDEDEMNESEEDVSINGEEDFSDKDMVVYKDKAITRTHPSGYYEYYSDKQMRFLKFDDLDDCKASIDEEKSEGY